MEKELTVLKEEDLRKKLQKERKNNGWNDRSRYISI